jgi:class 3 adenylate cyclase
LENLYEIKKRLGRFERALYYNEQLQKLVDTINQDESKTNIQRLEFNNQLKVDSLKKAEEDHLVELAHKEEVRKENMKKNAALTLGALLLIFAILLWSRLRYIRKAKEAIQEERDRSDSLLLNILPVEIAKELKDNGKADAKSFDTVSILFTDFKEFTQTSEKLSARELVEEINYFFKGFDRICGKYGIEKIKTIGDSYMAAGGLPVPEPEAVKRTVLAALEMQEFVNERKAFKENLGQLAFEMRAGINTGHVVAGIVGVKKFQYDIWGDTVNTASRMESHGEIGQVNISQPTFEQLENDPDFKFKSRGKIQTKGKGEIEMYFVEKSNAYIKEDIMTV